MVFIFGQTIHRFSLTRKISEGGKEIHGVVTVSQCLFCGTSVHILHKACSEIPRRMTSKFARETITTWPLATRITKKKQKNKKPLNNASTLKHTLKHFSDKFKFQTLCARSFIYTSFKKLIDLKQIVPNSEALTHQLLYKQNNRSTCADSLWTNIHWCAKVCVRKLTSIKLWLMRADSRSIMRQWVNKCCVTRAH